MDVEKTAYQLASEYGYQEIVNLLDYKNNSIIRVNSLNKSNIGDDWSSYLVIVTVIGVFLFVVLMLKKEFIK